MEILELKANLLLLLQQILNYLHYTQSYQKNNFLMFLLMFHLHKS